MGMLGDILAGVVKGSVAAVKWAGNAALEAMFTSNEDSELTYYYDVNSGENYFGDHNGCREVLGRTLLGLTFKRPSDSYLRLILSRCARVELDGDAGKLVYDKQFRTLCAKVANGDKSAAQKIGQLFVNGKITKETVFAASELYGRLFTNESIYSSFIREVFVITVGEDIEEPVYDDEGKILRDANGKSVTKVVGTNYGVARFKVTFSSGHKIKFKVCLNNGSWQGLQAHKYV